MMKANTLDCLNLFSDPALYHEHDTARRIKDTIEILIEGKPIEDAQAVNDAVFLIDSAIELTQTVIGKIDEVEHKGDFIELLKDLEALKRRLN